MFLSSQVSSILCEKLDSMFFYLSARLPNKDHLWGCKYEPCTSRGKVVVTSHKTFCWKVILMGWYLLRNQNFWTTPFFKPNCKGATPVTKAHRKPFLKICRGKAPLLGFFSCSGYALILVFVITKFQHKLNLKNLTPKYSCTAKNASAEKDKLYRLKLIDMNKSSWKIRQVIWQSRWWVKTFSPESLSLVWGEAIGYWTDTKNVGTMHDPEFGL